MAAKPRLEGVAPITLRPLEAMGVRELETLRLVLRGGSVVDWRRLDFQTRAEVDRFLEINLFDLEDPRDERRLRSILAQAVDYLRTVFGYRVADSVARPADVRDLFLLASGVGEPRRLRRIACVVLKVMHVVQHLEARELMFRTAVREADLAEKVDRRVTTELTRLRKAGLPIVEFGGSAKPRHSLMTKLLAKRDIAWSGWAHRVQVWAAGRGYDDLPAQPHGERVHRPEPGGHRARGANSGHLSAAAARSALITGRPWR